MRLQLQRARGRVLSRARVGFRLVREPGGFIPAGRRRAVYACVCYSALAS
jgi:hypothetical protein